MDGRLSSSSFLLHGNQKVERVKNLRLLVSTPLGYVIKGEEANGDMKGVLFH